MNTTTDEPARTMIEALLDARKLIDSVVECARARKFPTAKRVAKKVKAAIAAAEAAGIKVKD